MFYDGWSYFFLAKTQKSFVFRCIDRKRDFCIKLYTKLACHAMRMIVVSPGNDTL
jgi:hypothetical protein